MCSQSFKPLKLIKMTLRKKITEVEFLKKVTSVKGYTPSTPIKTNTYFMIGGNPHKMVNGQIVSLTKIVK
jgi:hypothetical protein|tara:strand:+ start:401 stop:610 length:210 start_codon:yes stop_codon:yes gene_type:complete